MWYYYSPFVLCISIIPYSKHTFTDPLNILPISIINPMKIFSAVNEKRQKYRATAYATVGEDQTWFLENSNEL